MNTHARTLVPIVTLLALVLGTVSLALAWGDDRSPRENREDRVVQQDRDAYKRNGWESRFGVRFRPHKEVCTEAVEGEVHCNARVVTDDAGAPTVTSDAPTPKTLPVGLTPQQLNSAYGLSGTATTSGRIIAIVDAYDNPNIQKDLDTYSTTFGIPKLPACIGSITTSKVPCFQKVNQNGKTTQLPPRNAGWALEIALDVQTAHAICQNCSILLVEARSASFADMMTAVDRAVAMGAKVVSNSYGAPEFSGETTYDSHFNKSGVAFAVSSGDSGYGVEYPAASRYVTAVGGTTLLLNPDGTYNSEVAWAGAGSGCSLFEAKQSWQTDSGCAKRMVADVSAVADPNTGAAVYDSYGYQGKKGWFQVGGTSLSAPVVAAIYAVSGITSGNANSLPYSLGNAGNLHDIASGSNGSCGGSYLCTSLAGFDGPTGLGSPKGYLAF